MRQRAMMFRSMPSSQSAQKVETSRRAVSAKTQKNVLALHEYSLNEMLKLINSHNGFTSKPINDQLIDDGQFKTIMFTVSSSDFRIIILLHFLKIENLSESELEYLDMEKGLSSQQYYDYIAELGNNFCGAICRSLNSANYSTGMSTPSILTNKNILFNFNQIGVDLACHMAANCGDRSLFCSSMCLISNEDTTVDLDITLPTSQTVSESQGELEFF